MLTDCFLGEKYLYMSAQNSICEQDFMTRCPWIAQKMMIYEFDRTFFSNGKNSIHWPVSITFLDNCILIKSCSRNLANGLIKKKFRQTNKIIPEN